jgi:hypothetical protein
MPPDTNSSSHRWLTLLLAAALPFCCHANSSKAQGVAIDLSIIKRSEELRPYMSMQQRLSMSLAEKIIESGESEIRSGTSLIQRKASPLKPDEDLKPSQERGKQMTEDGQTKIAEGQRVIIELLSDIENTRAIQLAAASQKFNFSPTQLDFETALNNAAEATLQACRKARYEHVFFDTIYLISDNQTVKASPELRNAAYDIFIQKDGTHFNVKIPMGLELSKVEESGEYTLHYESSAAFKNDSIALLAIEVITPSADSIPMLSVHALDWNTQKIITSSLTYLSNSAKLFGSVEESTQATTAGPVSEVTPVLPEKVLIRDEQMLIDGFATIKNPYLFQLTAPEIKNPAEALALQALLSDSIINNSDLILVDNDFIRRIYLEGETASDSFRKTATATLEIVPSHDNNGDYTILARGHNSDRTIEIGSMHLQFTAVVVVRE